MSRAAARAALLAAAVAGLTAACAHHRPQTPTTIGQLSDQVSVPVQTGQLPPPNPTAAMATYQQFLQMQNADPALRVEALRRLGDLNLEAGELERMSTEVSRVDVHGAQAIQLYTMLLKAYPNYPHNDEVLYQLARAYDTTGQTAPALATLDRIVAEYPHNSHLGEVQFRRGELLFSLQRYAEAQHAYEAVLTLGRDGSTFYPQSLYKRAWSQFKQNQNEACLDAFAQLLDYTLVDAHGQVRDLQTLARADRELVDDTLRVMSISFSYLDGPMSIQQLAMRRGHPPYAWLLYQRLGDLYVSKQRYQDAATTDRAFVADYPIDAHAPLLSMAAIEAYRRGGFPELMLQGKLEFVKRYGFSAPFWQGRSHTDFPEVVGELKVNLRDVAQYYHALAQKTHDNADYASAADWYRAYLASFPGEPDSAATNYLLADALFESGQYLTAATEYERTAYSYPPHARDAQAGYAALVAYQKYEDSLPPAARAPVHLRATESALHFAQSFPKDPASGGVLTRAAQDLFTGGDHERALAAARLLLSRPGVTAPQQRIGWSIVAQTSFDQGNYPAAEDAFKHALLLTPTSDPEHADLTERLAASIYKQGDSERTAGHLAAAADDFLRVAQVAPGSKIVETAQYDAAAALIDAQQWQRAIPILETLRREDPHGQYSAGIGSKLAVAYAAAGQSSQAASEFERIAATPNQGPAVVHEALGKAADLYQKSGDDAHATAMLERLVDQFPTPVPDAIEVRSRLAAMAARHGDTERTLYWQRQIVQADATAGAARTDRTRYLAAQGALALAAPLRDQFRDIKLVAPLKRSLAQKKRALEAAVQAYRDVAAYQVAQTTTAATFETAELYRTLSDDLLHSQRPPHLSADELDQYESLLEDQAEPFEEQAISIHEINAARAQQGVYDDSVRKSFAALAQLSPARYGKTEAAQLWVAALAAPVPAAHGSDDPPAVTSALVPAPAAAASGKGHKHGGAKHATPVAQSSAAKTAAAPVIAPPSAAALADFQHATDLANAGHDTDAQLELEQFELRYPAFPTPAIDLGLLARRDGKLDQSEVALRHATQVDASNPLVWTELGVTLREEGNFKDAHAAYAQALAIDPDYAAAHRDLGVLLDLYQGDAVAALAEFQRYKQLTGEDKPVSTWLADLRRRTGTHAASPAASPSATAPTATGAVSTPTTSTATTAKAGTT
ncbi:MAG TPA: tetratricopeptide repeat protein [Steroidobacteraceae bacterium]|nr:tetratricopeptide repeat protein [Steroidobacteraceae bacterium]